MSVSLDFTNLRVIPAPRERVWRVLSDIAGWPAWRPGLKGASGWLGKGGAWRVTLSPLGLPVKVEGQILDAEPGRLLRWRAAWGGVRAVQGFGLSDHTAGTLVEAREELEGWGLVWLRPFYSPRRIALAGAAWLADLDQALRGGEEGPSRLERVLGLKG